MKNHFNFSFKAISIILSFLIVFPLLINAQSTDNKSKRPVKNYWSVNANIGSNLFYGDLGKMENQWAYGLSISKKISPIFSLNLQGLYGTLKGSDNTIGQYFETDLFEYNLNVKVDISNLIGGLNPDRTFNFYFLIGVGISNFNSERYTIIGDTLVGGNGHFTQKDGFDMSFGLSEKKFKTGEGIIPVGLGCDIKLSKRFDLNIESTLRGINPSSDNLDGYIDNSSSVEGYGYTSVGITYKFGQVPKRVRPPKEIKPEKPVEIIAEEVKVDAATPIAINVFSELPDSVYQNSEFNIKIQINKGAITGKGRIQQTLPFGFTAMKTDETNGEFNFKDQVASLSWEELPDRPTLVSSFKVKVVDIKSSGYTIPGIFLYDENGTNKIHQFKNKTFVIEQIIVAELEEEVVEEVVTEEVITKEVVTTEPTTEVKSGIEYRVQVKAIYGGKDSPNRIAQRYNLTGPVYEDFHNGYTKYSNGSFKTYNEANTHKTKLRNENKVEGAFVVAFNNGNRLNSLKDVKHIQQDSPAKFDKTYQPGVEYRIQIAAFSKGKTTPSLLSNHYNITEPIREEFHNGLNKYTVGTFSNYNKAKSHLIQIRKVEKYAFIVKYYDGERQ